MNKVCQPWAVVLAGGEGDNGSTLEAALGWAGRSVRPDQQLVVVTGPPTPYWPRLQRDLFPGRLVIQPEDRGTLPAILTALLVIRSLAGEGGDAPLIVIPARHHASDSTIFTPHLDAGVALTTSCPDSIVVFGAEVTRPEAGHRWIEPIRTPEDAALPALLVRRVWPASSAAMARTLRRRGCLRHSGIMIGRGGAFLRVIETAAPDVGALFEPVVRALARGDEPTAPLERVYADLSAAAFEDAVLGRCPERVLVRRLVDADRGDASLPRVALAAGAKAGPRRLGPPLAIAP